MNVKSVPKRNDPYTDSLLVDEAWDATTLTFSFPTANQYSTVNDGSEAFSSFARLNDAQQTTVRAILDDISSFINLTFTEVSGAGAGDAVLRFGRTSQADPAYAYLPNPAKEGGDSWYSNDAVLSSPKLGNYAYFTFLHEIGHALGLAHPFENDGGGTMPADREWMAYTVMSYRSYQGAAPGFTNGDFGFAQSFMMEDIAALQHIYGANFSTNAGNTTYSWDPNSGEMFINGAGQGTPGDNTVFQTIWDGGGLDTYDFSNYTAGPMNVIDLRPGHWTNPGPGGQDADLGGSSAPGTIANAHLYRGNPASLIEQAFGNAGDNTIHGNAADNLIRSNGGDDEIFGYEGNDTLIGGDGWDAIFGGPGNDRLEGHGSSDELWGGDGNDTLLGGDNNDLLRGGAGEDRLEGGAFSDTLYGDSGNDYLDGGDGRDDLFGGDGDDELFGGADHDTLDGGAGKDRMAGGTGNDIYFLNDIGDVAIERDGEGDQDLVRTSLDYVATKGIEEIELLDGATTATGNALNNKIFGNAANNIIDGGSGVDSMAGGEGDDTYYVDHADDSISETGSGIDTVYASVSYILPEPVHKSPYLYVSVPREPREPVPVPIEILILTGSENLSGTGNEFANFIQGNTGDNVLSGLAGDDDLDGGTGADIMLGGDGDDIYRVDNLGDRAIESSADGGFDTVFSSVSHGLKANVEALTLTGTANLNGYGNAGDNQLTGNAGANTLSGGAGADIMAGGAGNDKYFVDDANDSVIEGLGQGFDIVKSSVTFTLSANVEALALTGTGALDGYGSDGDNWLYGTIGANTLDGKGGADVMRGGLGDDTYIVENRMDRAIEASVDGGTDVVKSTVSYGLKANIEVLALKGLENINAYGNAGANTLYGNAGDNLLRGNGGDDTMLGGDGDDLYLIEDSGDRAVETADGGFDVVKSAVSFTLEAHVEVLALTGSGSTSGTGNAQANWLYGNSGANTLAGGGGRDKLFGGDGADTLAGGTGLDELVGGTGADVFLFDTAPAAGNADNIRDFVSASDLIALDGSVFAGLANGSLSAAAFAQGSSALDADDRIIHNTTTGEVFHDADGSGAGAQVLVATIGAGTALAAEDFLVI